MFGGSKISIDEDLLVSFVFYGALLVFKMLIMAPLTARHRISNKVRAENSQNDGSANVSAKTRYL